MKWISILVISILLSNPIDKSIFEDLTPDEIATVIKEDSSFNTTFKRIAYIKKNGVITYLTKSNFTELTYRRMHNAFAMLRDTSIINPADREWKAKYGALVTKADSVSAHWKNVVATQGPAQYVAFKLVDVEQTVDSKTKQVKAMNLGFTLTPTKGTVDALTFRFKIAPKDTANKGKIWFTDRFSFPVTTNQPLTAPTKVWAKVSFEDFDKLANLSAAEILAKYNIVTTVTDATVGGVSHTNKQLNIPWVIEDYWVSEKNPYLIETPQKHIIKGLCGVNFVPRTTYVEEKVKATVAAKDPLAIEFIALVR